MKRRKTAAVLMAAALMLCSQGVIPVSAEEAGNGTEIMTQTSESELSEENVTDLETEQAQEQEKGPESEQQTEQTEETESQQKTETEEADGNADLSGEVQEETAEQMEEPEAAETEAAETEAEPAAT